MIKALTFALGALFCTGIGANAQVLSAGANAPYTAELIGAGPQSDGSQLAGIRIVLEPGWKTYWRNPGAGGIAPRFDWSRSRNLESVAFIWPAPSIFETYGTVSIGYSDELLLPVIMRPRDPEQPIEARVDLEFGVCSDICIPAEATMAALIHDADAGHAKRVKASIGRRAATAKEAGLKSAACDIAHKEGDEFVINAELVFASPRQGRQLLVIETGNEEHWISQTDTVVTGAQIRSQADLVNYTDGPLMVTREQLRLTLIGGGGAVDIRGCTG